MNTFEVKFRHHFDSAHQLPGYAGKCARLHGHRWEVEVVVRSASLDASGMVVDFSELKRIVDELDHCCLNGYVQNPTAENLASFLFDKLASKGIPVFSVRLWETPGASVEVRNV